MNVVCRLTRSRQYEVNAICRQPLADDHTARVVTVRKREFVCLFGFNVALKHLRSYHDGACL